MANKHIHQICESYKQRYKNNSLSDEPKSSPCLKAKRIAKVPKRGKAAIQEEEYDKEDLIIRFPKEFFDQ